MINMIKNIKESKIGVSMLNSLKVFCASLLRQTKKQVGSHAGFMPNSFHKAETRGPQQQHHTTAAEQCQEVMM